MKIKPEQLAGSLKKTSLPLYWLAGDDPLLMQESADLIRGFYREQEFQEREIFSVERGFDWESLSQSLNNLSLFSDRKIIELRLSNPRLDNPGRELLQAYVEHPSADILILISSPRIDSAILNSKWFKSIEANAGLIQIWPINREHLADWLAKRLLKANIKADATALQYLCERVEGNLLAATQEIEKLKLLASPGESGETVQLDADTVLKVVADSSRFTAFQLVDAALSGEASRAQRILSGLQNEGVFPLVILAAITRELHNLLPMLSKKQQGQSIANILQSSRVWFNRKQAVGNALRRLTTEDTWRLLDRARLIDQAIKGMNPTDPWIELSRLILNLSGKQLGQQAIA